MDAYYAQKEGGKFYYSKAALADMLNISERTVERLVQKGILRPEAERRERKQIFELTANIPQYNEYLRDQAARSKGGTLSEEARAEAERWDTKYKAAQAQIQSLKVDELMGKVHRSEDIEHFTMEMMYSLRGMMLALPGRRRRLSPLRQV
ncbi:MAG: hypothetical protein LBH28_03025, partial [Oscillospiraceae bacterium]|nr:hypothetical protein [Oscillospiraceae bacterium]